jgi:pimeloyl-ACP methyl ester carboxylesterase
LKTVAPDGIELAYWEWPGADPPLLFVHATSFHGRCWDQVIRRIPGRRSIAPDLRGHGRSAKPAAPYHWQAFGRDLAQLADALDLRDAAGIGHSMGGHSVVSAAALRPGTFASMVLIDPTIFPPDRYGQPALDASFIARRRNAWSSPEEMFERFRSRAPFALWQPGVLKDYCDFGLLPSGGEFVLACPPEVERSIYGHSTEKEADLHPAVPSIREPVVVIRGGVPWTDGFFNLNASPTDPALASRFPNGRDVLLEGRSHYIPMETPELVAEYVARIAAS